MTLDLMAKEKDISKTLTNGAIFSTVKDTDAHTVHGRSTLKFIERIFRYRSFHKFKIGKELNDLGKVLIEPNYKSNELSMNRKCRQRFTTDD